MKALILGDVHGHWTNMNVTIAKAIGEHPDITHIIQVGDFGYGFHGIKPFKTSKVYFSSEEQDIYDNATKLWLDGNHENFDLLEIDKGAWQPGWTYVPRGSILEADGYRMMFFGGASSIDRDIRTPMMDWWPQENITYTQVENCLKKHDDKIDALFTHEHADCVPYSDRYKWDDLPSKGNRQLLQELVNKFQPDFHFFGHHHAPDQGIIDEMEWYCCPIIDTRFYTIWIGTTVTTQWK